ncbi:MAG: Universal stress protein [Frankiales bacterium]|nr:Universal stress protein [Frankiales bacterium]
MAAARSVVVGADGSASSLLALRWAAARARRLGLALEVVHAVALWPYDVRRTADHAADPHADGRDLVGAALEELGEAVAGLEVRAVVEVSSPAALLLQRASSPQCVALGARGRGGFPHLHLGSTAGQVAAHAPCPVVVVRDSRGSGVVVGVDGSPASQAAVAFAFDEAEALGEPLTAVHAWLPVYAGLGDLPYYDDVRPAGEDDEALLAESLAGLREQHPDVDVRRSVVSLHPVPALLEASDGARLLVVGHRGRGGLERLLLGSVSRTLLHHAGCTVAVVRGPG